MTYHRETLMRLSIPCFLLAHHFGESPFRTIFSRDWLSLPACGWLLLPALARWVSAVRMDPVAPAVAVLVLLLSRQGLPQLHFAAHATQQ